LGGEQQGQ
jgi:hypothetical protein